MVLILYVALRIPFITFRLIKPPGNHFPSLKFQRRFCGRWILHSFFVDDIVFAYWEREVISTSLVSLLDPAPIRRHHTHIHFKASINCLFLFLFTPTTVPRRHCARLIAHHTHTHTLRGRGGGGVSLSPPPPLGLPTTHTP